ncbi:MAG: TetR/AcrR family transcriptional regulator [Sandaracinaceae bacterium]
MRRGELTRLALLRAAEHLFAEQGVEAVSLREVASRAGQKNVSAVDYYFGGRLELLECVLERHSSPMAERFSARVEAWRELPDRGPEPWVRLLVDTVAAKLDDDDGGHDYIRLCAQLTSSSSFPLTQTRSATAPGAMALSAQIATYAPPSDGALGVLPFMLFGNALYLTLNDVLRLRAIGQDLPAKRVSDYLTETMMRIAQLDDWSP